jgi:hypothetical protein
MMGLAKTVTSPYPRIATWEAQAAQDGLDIGPVTIGFGVPRAEEAFGFNVEPYFRTCKFVAASRPRGGRL